MKRDYRSRLARLEKAAQSRRASIPPITFSTSPEAVALRRELLEIAIRLTPERGWPDQQAVRKGMPAKAVRTALEASKTPQGGKDWGKVRTRQNRFAPP